MKNFIILTFGLVFFSTSHSYSQKGDVNYIEYYKYANEAEYFFYENQFDTAVYYYEKAFKIVSVHYGIHRYRCAKALWKTGQRKKATKMLKQGGPIILFERDSLWFNGMSEKERQEVVKAMTKNNKISRDDFAYYDFFADSIMVHDQASRNLIDSLKTAGDTAALEITWKLMEMQDSLNGIRLIDFIRKNGFPGGIAGGWNQRMLTLFMHMNHDWYFKNFDLLKDEIKKGNLEPWIFAMGFDRAMAIAGYPIWFNISTSSKYNVPHEFQVFQNCISMGVSPYYNYYWLSPARETANLWIYRSNKRVYNATLY